MRSSGLNTPTLRHQAGLPISAGTMGTRKVSTFATGRSGNEEWGLHEIGHRSPAQYAETAREWGKTIKKLDPTLQVLAVGDWRADTEVPWNTAVLEDAWPYIDYLTAHRYWNFNDPDGDDAYGPDRRCRLSRGADNGRDWWPD